MNLGFTPHSALYYSQRRNKARSLKGSPGLRLNLSLLTWNVIPTAALKSRSSLHFIEIYTGYTQFDANVTKGEKRDMGFTFSNSKMESEKKEQNTTCYVHIFKWIHN